MGMPSFRFENMWLNVEGFKDMVKGWPTTDVNWAPKSTVNATETTSNVIEDPFVVLESTSTPAVSSLMLFTDPLEEISKLGNSGSTRVDGSSATPSPPSHVNASPNETNSQERCLLDLKRICLHLMMCGSLYQISSLYTTHQCSTTFKTPPPRPTQVSRAETGSFGSNNARKKVNEAPLCLKSMNLKIFPWVGLGIMLMAMQRVFMEAMDRADAKFRHAKGVRERSAKASRSKEAGQAAVHRAQAEARERAAAEAKERAEKAAAEAKERTNTEAREKEARERTAVARAEAEVRLRTKRAAVERVVAEARERAAAEARERAATRVNQQKNENDLESFFSMSSRPSSAPRPRANFSDPMFGIQFQNRHGPEMARTSASASSTMRKASPTTNIVDDLSSIFGEVEGKVKTDGEPGWNVTKGLRSMRYAKALAEKNQWDLQT
ncbi:hypothetical protein AAG906_022708 [Vitis piasezkii]